MDKNFHGLQFHVFQPGVTFLLAVITFCYALVVLPIFPNQWIYERTAGVNILIAGGEWWRLLTPVFFHHSFHHFLTNGLSLYILGSLLEERVKIKSLLFIFFSSGMFANLFTFIFAPLTLVHNGSSGAIFGILGVWTSLILMKKIPGFKSHTLLLMGIFIVMQTFLQKDVNLYAHLGGWIWGVFSGLLLGGSSKFFP